MGEGGKWELRYIIYSGRVMRLKLKTWRNEKSCKDRRCAGQTVKSTGSRFWRANLTLNERKWPKVGFTREQGPVRPGHGWAFMQMLKSQPQAWIRQQWKFSVEENDREIGSWWSAVSNLAGFMTCIYAFVKKASKERFRNSISEQEGTKSFRLCGLQEMDMAEGPWRRL